VNPTAQPKFNVVVPNALDPGFKYDFDDCGRSDRRRGVSFVAVEACYDDNHITGLINETSPNHDILTTPIYGFKQTSPTEKVCTWPGMTFEVEVDQRIYVDWQNGLFPQIIPYPEGYVIVSQTMSSVVDTSLHWAYGLQNYTQYTIQENGTPIIIHLHGGHSDFVFDGNPEFFFNPSEDILGPQWGVCGIDEVPVFRYDDDQVAASIWYHDHTLGITRLNVYAGMAGFYIIRDKKGDTNRNDGKDGGDTGLPDNKLTLPAFPYEMALAIQDRMFKTNGEFFRPAFPGDPSYDDFITGEGVNLEDCNITNGGPTVLAEFFGYVQASTILGIFLSIRYLTQSFLSLELQRCHGGERQDLAQG
jgi:hypothetical protein